MKSARYSSETPIIQNFQEYAQTIEAGLFSHVRSNITTGNMAPDVLGMVDGYGPGHPVKDVYRTVQ